MWLRIGGILMALGIVFGAFGSHALKAKLDEYSFDVYRTAVLYHLIHALGIFVVAYLAVLSAGMVVHPIPQNSSPKELVTFLTATEARMLIGDRTALEAARGLGIAAMDIAVKVGFTDVGVTDPEGLSARPHL